MNNIKNLTLTYILTKLKMCQFHSLFESESYDSRRYTRIGQFVLRIDKRGSLESILFGKKKYEMIKNN